MSKRDEIKALRGTLTHREIAERVGVSRSYVARTLQGKYLEDGTERKERVGGQYASNKGGRDLWPIIPWQCRITERGASQAVPKALDES